MFFSSVKSTMNSNSNPVKALSYAILLVSILLLSGCATNHYDKVKTGELKGTITLKWKDPDLFLFEPDPDKPLSFTRHGETEPIIPKRMFTDGGSIPRPMRAFKNYSPWGYAPAFIIHDWLFVMQHCKEEGYENFTLESSALIMSEVMKTMMESPEFDFGDKETLYLMYQAVKTPVAQQWWENGKCKTKGTPRSITDPHTYSSEIEWDSEETITFE